MKKMLFLLVITILLTFCATSNKMANKAFYHALIGQDETTVCSRLGAPTDIVTSSGGGKILIYEFYTKGMFDMPEKGGAVKGFKLSNNKTGAVYNVEIHPYDKRYTSYQIDVTSLTVFFDQQGKCIHFEQDLPRERLEFYYERLKAYIPEK